MCVARGPLFTVLEEIPLGAESAAGAGCAFQNSSIPSSVWGGLSSLLASVLQAAIARDFLNAGALGLLVSYSR